MKAFLDSRSVLVPLPRSGFMQPGAHWPAHRICECLRAEGFGAGVENLLRRIVPLRSSATSELGHRPTLHEKYDSLGVEGLIATEPSSIVIVDDQITKGYDMFAAALRLSESFPQAAVRGFGMALTKGFVEDVASVLEPCVGRINRRADWEVQRDPW